MNTPTATKAEPQWLVFLIGLLIAGVLTTPTILAFEAGPLLGAGMGAVVLVIGTFVRPSREARPIRLMLMVLGSAYVVLGLTWWIVALFVG